MSRLWSCANPVKKHWFYFPIFLEQVPKYYSIVQLQNTEKFLSDAKMAVKLNKITHDP